MNESVEVTGDGDDGPSIAMDPVNEESNAITDMETPANKEFSNQSDIILENSNDKFSKTSETAVNIECNTVIENTDKKSDLEENSELVTKLATMPNEDPDLITEMETLTNTESIPVSRLAINQCDSVAGLEMTVDESFEESEDIVPVTISVSGQAYMNPDITKEANSPSKETVTTELPNSLILRSKKKKKD